MHGYEVLGRLLRDRGLDVVFSMLGGSNVPWIAAGVRDGLLRLVRTRHETTAVTAAVGYARATGRVGLCSVTRGPGFANCVDAMIGAVRTHVPLINIVGQSPSDSPTTAQNIDQRGFTALIGAGFHHAARVEDLPATVDAALHAALAGGRPQVLSIGDGVLKARLPEGPGLPPAAPLPDGPEPAPAAIAAAVDALEGAERPLLLAGQGALLADCRRELEELADLVGARVAGSLLASHFFAGHPQNLGLSGGWASALARRHLRDSDVVVAFGASLNRFTTGHGDLYRDAVVVQCDVRAAAFGVDTPVDVEIVGDAGAVARAMTAEWRRRGHASRPVRQPAPDRPEIARSVTDVPLPHAPAAGLDPRDVYVRLEQLLGPDRLVVTDSGRFVCTLLSILSARDARSLVVSRGYGSIGQGLGAAIGAAVARPADHTVLVTGDGGLMMAAQDLDAIRLAGIDLTVVVMNDRAYGSELLHLAGFGLPDDVARLDTPDLVALARVHGGDGATVRTPEDLAALTLPRRGLYLVDVHIDPGIDGHQAVGPAAEEARHGHAAVAAAGAVA
jgi:acetolactate synthase I/II/III large subunit